MLTTEQFKEIIEKHNIPCTFSHFNDEIAPPFMLWIGPKVENFNADGIVYYSTNSYELELYTRVNTTEEEEKLEAYLTGKGLVWQKGEQDWLDEFKVFSTGYTIYG